VFDNGDGLSVKDGHFGYGLIGMRERVESIGGSLAVKNRVEQPGVSIVATFPLAKSDLARTEAVS
jgi:two-component system, NarL family, sensor histidine kinase UhpB